MDKKLQIAYASGLIDGEGCIAIGRQKSATDKFSYALHLIVVMVDYAPIKLLIDLWGGKASVVTRKGIREGDQLRVFYRWCLNSSKAKNALLDMCPFLVGKKSEADVAIEFALHMEKRRNHLYRVGVRGSVSVAPEDQEYREYLFQKIKALKGIKYHTRAAETNSENTSNGDVIVRTEGIGNLQREPEMALRLFDF